MATPVRLPMADCHDDLLMGVVHQQERGRPDPFGEYWLPQLRAGGVVLQVLPIYTEEQFLGEGALRRALRYVEAAWRIAREHATTPANASPAAALIPRPPSAGPPPTAARGRRRSACAE